jgi:hypothetical protein
MQQRFCGRADHQINDADVNVGEDISGVRP